MSQINEIGKRFDTALSVLNLTNKQIAEDFNTSSQNISNLKKTDKINDLLSRIAVHYGININWIATGQGDMLLKSDTQTNNFQHSNIFASGVDNSEGSSHIFNQNNSNTSFIPDFVLEDLEILFKRCKGKTEEKKELIDAIDNLIFDFRKKCR